MIIKKIHIYIDVLGNIIEKEIEIVAMDLDDFYKKANQASYDYYEYYINSRIFYGWEES